MSRLTSSTEWNQTENWEKVKKPDQHILKKNFKGEQQPTKKVKESVSQQLLDELHIYLQTRIKGKKSKLEEHNTGELIPHRLMSEVFFNKDGVGIYCFDGILEKLFGEDYTNDVNSMPNESYSVILLSELVRKKINDLFSPNFAHQLFLEEYRFSRSKRRK